VDSSQWIENEVFSSLPTHPVESLNSPRFRIESCWKKTVILHHTKNLFILDADQDHYKFNWFEKIEMKEGDNRKNSSKIGST
jgi:hypothetical protein